jgi:hypothetical protein
MSDSVPTRTLPIGQPIPLEKQKLIVSKSLTYTSGEIFYSTRAFKRRAPSKCILNLLFLAIFLTFLTNSKGIGAPLHPPYEFSREMTAG